MQLVYFILGVAVTFLILSKGPNNPLDNLSGTCTTDLPDVEVLLACGSCGEDLFNECKCKRR